MTGKLTTSVQTNSTNNFKNPNKFLLSLNSKINNFSGRKLRKNVINNHMFKYCTTKNEYLNE